MSWVTIDAMAAHWERARVQATLTSAGPALKTENVTALTLAFPPGWSPFSSASDCAVEIDGTRVSAPRSQTDRSWRVALHRQGGQWTVGALPPEQLRKRHDLQGPIDDAFMDSFIFVRPTGKSANAAFGAWVEKEQAHAIEHWRRHFRGEASACDRALAAAFPGRGPRQGGHGR
jgi:hypothetical protein